MTRLVDVTVPVREGMPVYPDNPAVTVERVREVEGGAPSTLSRLCMGTHTGTHVDAPMHFLGAGAPGIDEMPGEVMVGAARVIEIADERAVTADELARHDPRPAERLLLKTRNSALWSSEGFRPDYVHLTTEAAELLADRRIALLGVDYLSVGGYRSNGREVHRALLGAGIYLIEGLDLSDARAGSCEVYCLPLRLAGAEGAPARVLLRQ
ncbi:MAG: cyclase family protein [Coriobacteriia bacterium]|nr:cyclase family protein [Coriobacteriia bacterium]